VTRAAVLEAPRRLRVRALERPVVADDDAVLRVEACGLCGTDHEQYTGLLFGGFAFVPGHETVGVIDEIGDDAARRWGVAVGDRVAVEVFQSCRACARCEAGEYRHCTRHGVRDMYGYVPVDRPPGLWGGYAELQYLAPDSMLVPVPAGLDPVLATLFNPVGAGIRWGVTLPGTAPGDVVAVLGPGIRGLSVVAATRDAGAGFVMVTGKGERDRARLDLARAFGADLSVDVATQDARGALRDATGGLADVVVDVTANAPAALAQAVELARPGGTVVVAGMRGTDPIEGFRPDLIVLKELRVLGALGVDVVAYRAALDLVASGRHPFADVPRRVAGIEELAPLLDTMAVGTAAREGGVDAPVHAVVQP
jgi:alcohol dehydrogenase